MKPAPSPDSEPPRTDPGGGAPSTTTMAMTIRATETTAGLLPLKSTPSGHTSTGTREDPRSCPGNPWQVAVRTDRRFCTPSRSSMTRVLRVHDWSGQKATAVPSGEGAPEPGPLGCSDMAQWMNVLFHGVVRGSRRLAARTFITRRRRGNRRWQPRRNFASPLIRLRPSQGQNADSKPAGATTVLTTFAVST